ncbi:MAG TPA: hypothetical protein DDW76_15005 [Cyanobacteria bacterium UBA11369]|nr:hypothetical protein [Cyanobacteria bacterium UBA11371]HBE31406.1 hypothetical protein [Cyanobacteria bacterium UBA11368]HBE50066.1 hypothetical protein [Cyanobacteria bacterium UBA11369]
MPIQFNKLPEQNNSGAESRESQNVAQQLENLKRSHSQRYDLTKLEIWALVSTMDDFLPGFWSRFMVNRQVAFKEYLQQKKTRR